MECPRRSWEAYLESSEKHPSYMVLKGVAGTAILTLEY